MQRKTHNEQLRLKAGAFITLLFVMVACSEVISLRTEGSEERLVINGRLTDGLAGNEVNLFTTSEFNLNQQPVSGARVTLIEDGTEIAQYREFEPGAYRLEFPNDSAREGRSYELLISLGNGKRYRSQPAIMPGSILRDDLRVELGIFPMQVNETGLTEDRRMARLFVTSMVLDSEQDFYSKWDIYDTWMLEERLRIVPPGTPPPTPCYITNNISGPDLRLYNGADVKVDNIPERLFTFSEIDMRFAINYFFHVVNSTFDEAAHEYLTRVHEIANLSGSIFDQPPAPIPGNVVSLDDPFEEVLGYFLVVNTDTSRIKITANEVPWVVPKPCPDWNRFNEPPYCTHCPLVENSTRTRPYYWY